MRLYYCYEKQICHMKNSLKHRSIMTTAESMFFINPFTFKITFSQLWREATSIRGEQENHLTNIT